MDGLTHLTIREATAADLPAVLAIYAQATIDNGNVLPLAEAERIFARFRKYPDYHLYVALLERRAVGTFALLVMDNLGHLGTPSAIAEDVAVVPELHGRGIGRAMMQFALELATRKGCYKLALSSNLKRAEAHRFYESLDFERHGYSFRKDLP